MKVAKAILVNYLTCTDPVMQEKWANLLDSYWHKDEGQLVTELSVNVEGDVTVSIKDAAGNITSTVIEKYVKPGSEPISYITGLQTALNNKVDKITGKQLSTEDFTTELKNKLDGLVNYVHPDFHLIAEISGLQDIIDDFTNQLSGDSSRLIKFNTTLFFQSDLNVGQDEKTFGDWAIRVKPDGKLVYGKYNGVDGSEEDIFTDEQNLAKSAHESFVAVGGETEWVLPNTPDITQHYVITKNGLVIYEDAAGDYTLLGDTVTWVSTPLAGDRIQIWYKY